MHYINTLLSLLLLSTAAHAYDATINEALTADEQLIKEARGRFGTISHYAKYRLPPPAPEAVVALGEKLFKDPRLSKNNNVSCHSCHPVENGQAGMDGLSLSPGSGGELGTRNSPTVLNSALHSIHFWDGRVSSLEAQAKEPLLNPKEMAMESEESIVNKLKALADYNTAFTAAFGETNTLTFEQIISAIVAFENTLITHDRFDDFQNGDANALSAQEKQGLRTFIDVGCIDCHAGELLGGKTIEKLGIYKPFPVDNGDLGRYHISTREMDKMRFKGCSLRNVGLTAPYFHTGHEASLVKAVKLMAAMQKKIELTDQQAEDIAAFLHSLSAKSLTQHAIKN